MLFVESRPFRRRVESLLNDDELAAAQHELAAAPQRWPLVPGTGGARKARAGRHGRGKGKRGGVRILYLYVPRWEHIHLLVIYGKDDLDNLNPAERVELRRLVKAVLAGYRGRKR